MADRARKLLDEILGQARHFTENEINDLTIPENCIHHSIGICPHYSLENTKGFIRKCTKKEHTVVPLSFFDEKTLKTEEKRLLSICKNIICELELRKKEFMVKEGKENSESQQQMMKSFNKVESLAKAHKIQDAEKFIAELSKKMETITDNVKVNICETCGIKLTNSIASKEYQSHLNGKLHKSYLKIRETLAVLLLKYEKDADPIMSSAEIKRIATRIGAKKGVSKN